MGPAAAQGPAKADLVSLLSPVCLTVQHFIPRVFCLCPFHLQEANPAQPRELS